MGLGRGFIHHYHRACKLGGSGPPGWLGADIHQGLGPKRASASLVMVDTFFPSHERERRQTADRQAVEQASRQQSRQQSRRRQWVFFLLFLQLP